MARQAKMRPAFVALHVATLDPATTAEVLGERLAAADAVQDRHRLSEGAVYMSAQRRYTMLTGTDWRTAQQPDDAATWGESDHRLRVKSRHDGSYDARCSCGAAMVVFDRDAGTTWHDDHTAGRMRRTASPGRWTSTPTRTVTTTGTQ